LIDVESGKVIGTVTRKQTGLSENFDELISSFNNNIEALENSRGMFGLGNIDPIAMLSFLVQYFLLNLDLSATYCSASL